MPSIRFNISSCCRAEVSVDQVSNRCRAHDHQPPKSTAQVVWHKCVAACYLCSLHGSANEIRSKIKVVNGEYRLAGPLVSIADWSTWPVMAMENVRPECNKMNSDNMGYERTFPSKPPQSNQNLVYRV